MTINLLVNKVRRPLQILGRAVEGLSNLYTGAGEAGSAIEAFRNRDWWGALGHGSATMMSGLAGIASFATLKFCFPAGTAVSTPAGSRPIQTIRIGDEVWAYDVVARTWQPRKVVQTFSSQYEGMMVYLCLDGEQVVSTARHRSLGRRCLICAS